MWLSAGGLAFGVAGDRGYWCPEEYHQSFRVSDILHLTTGLPASSSSFLSLSACHPFFGSGLNIVPLPTLAPDSFLSLLFDASLETEGYTYSLSILH